MDLHLPWYVWTISCPHLLLFMEIWLINKLFALNQFHPNSYGRVFTEKCGLGTQILLQKTFYILYCNIHLHKFHQQKYTLSYWSLSVVKSITIQPWSWKAWHAITLLHKLHFLNSFLNCWWVMPDAELKWASNCEESLPSLVARCLGSCCSCISSAMMPGIQLVLMSGQPFIPLTQHCTCPL